MGAAPAGGGEHGTAVPPQEPLVSAALGEVHHEGQEGCSRPSTPSALAWVGHSPSENGTVLVAPRQSRRLWEPTDAQQGP